MLTSKLESYEKRDQENQKLIHGLNKDSSQNNQLSLKSQINQMSKTFSVDFGNLGLVSQIGHGRGPDLNQGQTYRNALTSADQPALLRRDGENIYVHY